MMTPNTWLWEELAVRFGQAAADAFRADYLTYQRRWTRIRRGSLLDPDAPALYQPSAVPALEPPALPMEDSHDSSGPDPPDPGSAAGGSAATPDAGEPVADADVLAVLPPGDGDRLGGSESDQHEPGASGACTDGDGDAALGVVLASGAAPVSAVPDPASPTAQQGYRIQALRVIAYCVAQRGRQLTDDERRDAGWPSHDP